MIVCHCHAVTDREIRSSVRGGASSAGCVGAACGAGTGCGGCLELVEEIVDDELTAQAAQRGAPLPLLGRSLTR
jgi:bacterioferritin-associated ferredoxin